MRKFESFSFRYFFRAFPCVNAKLATVHCEKHVPLANLAYTFIFYKFVSLFIDLYSKKFVNKCQRLISNIFTLPCS